MRDERIRNFIVAIKDSGGEEQEYKVSGAGYTPWTVLMGIAAIMNNRGDFYGHKKAETQDVAIHELVEDADMSDAIPRGQLFQRRQ